MTLPPDIPPRIARLDRDPRGYPIPWNVLREDGKPYFVVNDDRRHMTALFGGLCPICGQLLARTKWFVGGPRSAFDPRGCYIDLPMHYECAQFALRVCPWLAAPHYHETGRPAESRVLPPSRVLVDETQIPDRPVLFVAIASTGVMVDMAKFPAQLPRVGPIKPIIAIEYWRHGAQLDRAEGEALVRGVMGAPWKPPVTA
jgi:hypothetical protein